MDSRKDKTHSTNETRSAVTSTTGGHDEEIGMVTGELEVLTRHRVEGIGVAVRCVSAEEWYTVEGSLIELGNTSGLPPSALRELHEHFVSRLKEGANLREVVREEYVLHHASPEEVDELVREERLPAQGNTDIFYLLPAYWVEVSPASF